MDRQPQGGGGPRGFDPRGEQGGSRPHRGAGPQYDRGERYGPDDRAFEWDDPREGVFGYAESGLSDDVEVEQSVRMSLFLDTWLDADRIDVEVDDGVATLTGEVEDYLQARYAWDDAWETEGVRGVISRLEVRTADGDADESDPEDDSGNASPTGKPEEDKA